MLKTVTIRATLLALTTTLSMTAHAVADSLKQVDIPAGNLSTALLQLSKQYGADLVYRPEQIYGLSTHGAHGNFTTQQAVTKILEGTKLELRADPSGAMLIAPVGSRPPGQEPSRAATAPNSTEDGPKEGGKSSPDNFRLAQETQGSSVTNASVETSQTSDSSSSTKAIQLEEVIVTAEKRDERLQDVPVPVAVIGADTLFNSNQLRLVDYFSSVPGLSVEAEGSRGAPILVIRGISTGDFANPTVGITIDDVPYGSSTYIGGGYISPDIDPTDLARVEVLRGPQGTLYGVSSIGGLIKYVTVDPSTTALSGQAQVGTSGVDGGNGLGYSVRGSINVPVTDSFAIRASGFTRLDPGYIDDVQSGQNDVNWSEAQGGRLATLWHISDALSLKLSALIQDTKTGGSAESDIALSSNDLQQSKLRDTGEFEKKIQAYSANFTAKLGSATLTSITGYGINSATFNIDDSAALGGLADYFFNVEGAPFLNEVSTRKLSEELRLSTPIGRRLEWLLGAFYTHEDSNYSSLISAAIPASGALISPVGGVLSYYGPTTYEEFAGFTDLTIHFTDEFDIQLGGRESEIRQSSYAANDGAAYNYTLSVTPKSYATDHAFTYLITPRYKISPDLMLYTRFASGYRPGGPNANYVYLHVPSQYDPDKTQNYDVGIKGDFLDHTLSVDASLYYIDWKDVQITLNAPDSPGSDYIANGGGAKSQGIELSLQEKPIDGLTLSGWVTWTEAVLTQNLPSSGTSYGITGEQLPFVSRFSGYLSAQQDFPIASQIVGFVGADVSYVGAREGLFQGTPQRQSYPGYAKTDAHAGVNYGTWTLNAYVNNLTDRRGILTGGLDAFPTSIYYFIQPRVIGMSVAKKF